jgi:anaerobic magnesium-protoporphyrin IX monomethyl ester cyclase
MRRQEIATPAPNEVDVLLVNPPYDRLQGHKRDHFPLGLAYLAGALKQAGLRAAIYNAEASRPAERSRPLGQSEMGTVRDRYLRALTTPDHPVWREAADVVAACAPKVVGLTVFTEKIDAARHISRMAKETLPDTTVVWGGPHPTARPVECLGFPEVDFVVQGEGENALTELTHAILSPGVVPLIPGVSRRSTDGTIESGAAHTLQNDLDSFAPPDWDAALSADDWPAVRNGGRLDLMTSRGCPFRCQYCASASMWGRRVRYHSIDRVMSDIDELERQSGKRRVYFYDDSFTINRNRVETFCDTLTRQRRPTDWTCLTRADLMDVSMARHLKEAGCRFVTFGVESASPRILEAIQKGIVIEQTNQAMAACRAAGLTYGAFYMIGLPDETEDDVRLTVEHMRRSGASIVAMSVFTPYPGSPLFDRIVDMGLLENPPDWSRYGRHGGANHFAPQIPHDRFRELTAWAFREADRVNHKPWRQLKRQAKDVLTRISRVASRR